MHARHVFPLLAAFALGGLPAARAQPVPEFDLGRSTLLPGELAVDERLLALGYSPHTDLAYDLDVLDLRAACADSGDLHERHPDGFGIQSGFAMSGDGCKVVQTSLQSTVLLVVDRCEGRSWFLDIPGFADMRDTLNPSVSRDGRFVVFREASGPFVLAPRDDQLFRLCITTDCLDGLGGPTFTLVDSGPRMGDFLLPEGTDPFIKNQATPQPYISDDGSVVAYMKEGRVVIAEIDATGTVTHETLPGTPGVEAVAVSGDGRRLVFLATGNPVDGCLGPRSDVHVVYWYDRDGPGAGFDQCFPLGYERNAGVPGFAGDLAVTRDGRRAFWASDETWDPFGIPQAGATDIYTGEREGDDFGRNLTREAAGSTALVPRTSVAGASLAFLRSPASPTRFREARIVLRNLYDSDVTSAPLDLSTEEPASPHDLVELDCTPQGGFPISDCGVRLRSVADQNVLALFGRRFTDGTTDWQGWTVQSVGADEAKKLSFAVPHAQGLSEVVYRVVGPGLQFSLRDATTSP